MPVIMRTCLAQLLFLAVQPIGAQEANSKVAGRRPNILLILADDLGYSDLGCFGGEIPTPHIDGLAKSGLRYTQCYNSARCCPTRASLLTGLHPHQAGVGSFATRKPDKRRGPAYLGHLNDRCVTLAEVLGAAGYGTYMVGKWHVGLPGPIVRGFGEFYGFRQGYEQDQWKPSRYERLPAGRKPEIEVGEHFYATDVFTDYALEFLRQAQREKKPWFIYLAHSAPHFPVQAPRASVDALVETYRRGWDVLRKERFARLQALGLATESFVLTPRSMVPVEKNPVITNGFGGDRNPPWSSLQANRRADLARRMAVFAAMVKHIDDGVGRIVAQLRANGELDNTLILFTSDNGACYEWGPFGFDGPSRRGVTKLHAGDSLASMGGAGTYHAYGSAWANLGNTPFRLYKHFAHEGGICSPLIVHWPKGIARRDVWVRDPIHVMDVMPTLCDVAAARYPDQIGGRSIHASEGVSLTPTFRGVVLEQRTLCFEHQQARAIRKGNWKAVWGKRMPDKPSWELYDLEVDRCEVKDLAAKRPELVRALGSEWVEWARRVGVQPFARQAAK